MKDWQRCIVWLVEATKYRQLVLNANMRIKHASYVLQQQNFQTFTQFDVGINV